MAGETVSRRRSTESEEFVDRADGKKLVAWEEFYTRYYEAFCAYSVLLTGDVAFAEGLVQVISWFTV